MRPLSRRALFALPLVAPLAVAAAAQATPSQAVRLGRASLAGINMKFPEIPPIKPRFELREVRRMDSINDMIDAARKGIDDVIARMKPSARDLAATLGIPHEEPYQWTDADVAMTLGIDIQRDGVAVSAMAVRT